MKNFLSKQSLIGACALFFLSAPALSLTLDQVEITYDSQGMPRCLEERGRFYNAVLFHWNSRYMYHREVRAIRLDRLHFAGRDEVSKHCGNWRALVDAIGASNQGIEVSEGAQEVYDFPLSPRVQSAFQQIRLGGNLYRPPHLDGSGFVEQNQLTHYDLEWNARLTRDYGPLFSAEVYAQVRERRPRNQLWKARVNEILQTPGDSLRERLRAELMQTEILIAPGYMEDPGSSKVEWVRRQLQTAGVSASKFNYNSLDPIEENAVKIARQLVQWHETTTKNFVLVSASKGGPETLLALALIQRERPDILAAHRIRAVLMLSPTLFGSFLVDWASSFPQNLFTYNFLRDEVESSGLSSSKLSEGFDSQATDSLTPLMNTWSVYFPRSLNYFEISGVQTYPVSPAFSLLGLGEVERQIRLDLLDSALFPRHLANDGMIEYPLTEIPAEWGLRSYQLTIHSGHSLLDGFYSSYVLSDEAQGTKMLYALILSLFRI